MSLSKELLEELYNKHGLSMAEIAQQLGCSPNKVAYWMIKYQIPRRDISEAIYHWQNPDGDPFEIRLPESDDGYEIFHLGVGLYIGEGGKKNESEVSISNTDPRVIRAFIRFLSEICSVDAGDLFAEINVFDDVDLESVQRYWEKETSLSRSQFHKPMVRASRGGTYTAKSQVGTIKVGVYNTRLHRIIIDWCNEALKY